MQCPWASDRWHLPLSKKHREYRLVRFLRTYALSHRLASSTELHHTSGLHLAPHSSSPSHDIGTIGGEGGGGAGGDGTAVGV